MTYVLTFLEGGPLKPGFGLSGDFEKFGPSLNDSSEKHLTGLYNEHCVVWRVARPSAPFA